MTLAAISPLFKLAESSRSIVLSYHTCLPLGDGELAVWEDVTSGLWVPLSGKSQYVMFASATVVLSFNLLKLESEWLSLTKTVVH